MKLPQFRLRSLLLLIAVSAVLLTVAVWWLRPSHRPYSTVLDKFDPKSVLQAPGWTVQGIERGATFNIPGGYASKSWRGVITVPNDPTVRAAVQSAVEKYVAKLTEGRYHSEGTLTDGPPQVPKYAGLPAQTLLMYNEQEWHGEMHIWLFPDSSATRFGYAILLREELLK